MGGQGTMRRTMTKASSWATGALEVICKADPTQQTFVPVKYDKLFRAANAWGQVCPERGGLMGSEESGSVPPRQSYLSSVLKGFVPGEVERGIPDGPPSTTISSFLLRNET